MNLYIRTAIKVSTPTSNSFNVMCFIFEINSFLFIYIFIYFPLFGRLLLHLELFLSCSSMLRSWGTLLASLTSNTVLQNLSYVDVSFPLSGVTYNCWWGDVDACNWTRADVIDQVAENHTVHECGPQVFMQADLESHLDALGEESEGIQLSTGNRGSNTVFMNWDINFIMRRRIGTLRKHFHYLTFSNRYCSKNPAVEKQIQLCLIFLVGWVNGIMELLLEFNVASALAMEIQNQNEVINGKQVQLVLTVCQE